MHAPDAQSARELRNHELRVLTSIASALNGSVDLASSLGVALSRVAELLDLESGWVWLLDEQSGCPYLAAVQNLPAALAEQPEWMEGHCFCLTKFCRGELRGAANIVTCSRLERLTDGTEGLRFHASIPLLAANRKLGVMNVASATWHELSDDQLELLHIIGEMVGTAVERSRLYARSLEAGVVEERNRLAREIHDTIAQGLSATTLQLETADALLEAGAEPQMVREAISRALGLTRTNLEDARRSVLDLRSTLLEGRTLSEALEQLCTAAAGGGPDVRLSVVGAARPLSARLESGLYRVAQELLANVLQHASASRVSVQLIVQPKQIVLGFEDDGCGFEVASAPSGRFGLVGMRERIRLLGGELLLHSAPGRGTCVEARVPLD